MEKGTLSEAAFAEFGEQVVLFCHITSRVDSDPYQDLLGEKGGRGFPYFVILDAAGEVLAPHNGPRTIDGFRGSVAAANTFVELVAKAEKGDKKAALEVFRLRVNQGTIDPAVARTQLAEMDLPVEERSAIETKINDAELNRVLSTSRDPAEAARKVAAMHEAGRVPSAENAANYWFFVARHAEASENADQLAVALEHFRKAVADNPRARSAVEQFEKSLEKLIEKKK